MEGASTLDRFVSLTPTEAFAVEYWPLERYKLSLAPAESLLSRQVALVTGAAGGIGRAICQRLLADGASVVVADINFVGAEESAAAFNKQWGSERALAVQMDVTDETSVREGFRQAIEHFGGLDIVVNNAGLATSRPVTETSLAEWNKNMAVLGTGYFLVAREAFRILTEQKLGGSLVFIGSKNSIAAGKNASAYSAAKAAELHLARCLAEEGGAHGIRVNSVLPDAVLQGSQIWNGNWRAERATAYGIEPHQLEEYYRQRTTLKVNVLPDDIAEAVAFFASSSSAKTTGGVLTVDGGVPTAYVR
jgi:NAD(P)-dependent dehydrogenase (short-subunit alcohol dehydrogenase family)